MKVKMKGLLYFIIGISLIVGFYYVPVDLDIRLWIPAIVLGTFGGLFMLQLAFFELIDYLDRFEESTVRK